MALDNAKNFALTTLASGITSGATSLTVVSGTGSRFPTPPFNATIWNSTDFADPALTQTEREIVRVTAIAGDVFTITRAQEATAAVAHNTVGKSYAISAGITAKVINTDIPALIGGGSAGYADIYDARDYLPTDGTTDATAALQALLNTIGTNKRNAIIELDAIDYVIGGALQEGSRRNAQILLPSVAITERQYSVKLRGQTTPAFSPSGYEPIAIPQGTRIKSTLSAGSGSDPSVISGRGPVGGYLDETNYLKAQFENIIFTTVANPSYSCVNMRRFTSVFFRDCLVVAGNSMSVPAITQPTTATSYGVIFPQYNSGVDQAVEGELNVVGFYTGIRGGELMNCEQLGAWGCKVGLELPFSYHISLVHRFLLFWSPIGIKWTAAHPVDIQQFAIESTLAAEARWFKSIYEIDDPTNVGRGEVRWWNVQASFGALNSIAVNGALNLNHYQIGAATRLATAAPLSPEESIWVWNDTATSGAVGQFEVALNNATLASATLLRIAEISDTTVSATLKFGELGLGDDVTLRRRNDSDIWIRFDIIGPGTDQGEYWTFPIAFQASSTSPTFVPTSQISVEFTDNGTPAAPMVAHIFDSFTDANGTPILSHTPDLGPMWSKIEGATANPTIQSGKLQGSADNANAYAYVRNAGEANGTLTAKYVMGAGVAGQFYCELIVRETDASNYWLLSLSNLASNNMQLIKREAGANTTVAQQTFTVTPGVTYNFAVILSGSSISFSIDGSPVLSTSNAFNSTATNHGFRLFQATANVSTMDDHKFE